MIKEHLVRRKKNKTSSNEGQCSVGGVNFRHPRCFENCQGVVLRCSLRLMWNRSAKNLNKKNGRVCIKK